MADSKRHRPALIRRYTSIPVAIDMVSRGELVLLDPSRWEDRNDRHYMQLYKERNAIGGLYALCGATCAETYHHWRVFTASADGACVEFYKEKLEAILLDHAHVRAKEVRYLTLESIAQLGPRSARDLPFLKRYAFKPESEYRIIAESAEPQRPTLAIPLPLDCIARILLNPWLSDGLAATMKTTIAAIPDSTSITVEHSHLLENAKWKRAGERIAGRQPAPAARARLRES